MPEDPELAYLDPTARDTAIYMGPVEHKMLTEALAATGKRDHDSVSMLGCKSLHELAEQHIQ